jgi:hypothetical protein
MSCRNPLFCAINFKKLNASLGTSKGKKKNPDTLDFIKMNNFCTAPGVGSEIKPQYHKKILKI